ncbi:MAG: membrane protein insertase YidC [Alistipes sp.]
MNENKQSIIGFILIGLIFLGFVLYTNYEQSKFAAATESQQTVATEQSDAVAETVAESAASESAEHTQKVAQPEQQYDGLVADAPNAEEIEVENDVLKILFTTAGAQIKDVTLKEYTKYAPKEERNQLVHLFDPESVRFDMAFYLKHNLRNVKVNTAEHNFELLPIESGENAQIVTMRLPIGEDASLDYVYTIYNEMRPERDYLVDFEVRMRNLAPLMANQTSIGLDWANRSYRNERSFKNENTYTTLAYHFPSEIGIEDLGISTSSKDKRISSSVDWVSFKQQYFSSTLIARNVKFSYADVAFDTANEQSGFIKEFSLKSAVEYTPQSEAYKFSFYLGPNKYSVLRKVVDERGESLSLERAIPLGWILSSWISRWVVIPVFDFLQQYIASFGLIILILTLLVKIVIFPLTYKSYLSTAKMRVLKPEIEAINAKYPKQEDAMKKQQATMELYKKADVNIMGGCIPALIQMPILIAMFRFFPASIELRGQSFLWSDDLSSYDSILQLPFNIPFYGDHVSLFALLMAVVFFAFSYMNYQQSASSQPQMAGMKFMMVYMMPIMMLLWFNDYSSGLCYYYLLSNLITIIQTVVIRHLIDDNKIHELVHSNMAKNTNGKKSRFQQKYEELMRQQEQMQRQQRKNR